MPGFFSGSSHTGDLKVDTLIATLPGAWRNRVSAGTCQPGVSILWLGEIESLVCNFYLSMAAREIEQIRSWDTLGCCWDIKQQTSKVYVEHRTSVTLHWHSRLQGCLLQLLGETASLHFHTFTCHLGFVYPLQDVALHQCLPLSSACCFPVPGGSSFLAMSCHLLLGRPLDLFPLLGCQSVQRLVHLLSFILAICPAHLHFCFSVYSMMSVIFVFFLISEHGMLSCP